MLSNKRFTIILSLVIAICIWGYVIGETNPVDTRTFRSVPIQLVNEESLQEKGLAVLETSDTEMNITIIGTRADISGISEREIAATVNLADAAKGENELKIDLHIPDSVEIENKSLNKITVIVEESRSKKVDVEVDYQGSFAEDEEPITVDMSRESVVVSGPVSQVDKVSYVRAVVGAGKVTDQPESIKCGLTPVNKSGAEVKSVNLSAQSVTVTAELAKTKTVPLDVPVVDNSSDLYTRNVSAPEEITIKGRSSDLEAIDSISAQSVDISDITENTSITLTPILPENVQVSSKSSELTATVTVEPPESRKFTFSGSNVEITGLGDELSADVRTDSITVTLTGRKEDIDKIAETDFNLTISVSGLQAGSHQVELRVECSGSYSEISVNPDKIRVIIE